METLIYLTIFISTSITLMLVLLRALIRDYPLAPSRCKHERTKEISYPLAECLDCGQHVVRYDN